MDIRASGVAHIATIAVLIPLIANRNRRLASSWRQAKSSSRASIPT
jgi:hypothetical protein